MKKIISIFLVFSLIVIGIIFANDNQDKAKSEKHTKEQVKQEQLLNDVRVVFKKHCSVAGCHRGKYPKKKLNLEDDKFVEAIVNVPSLQIDTLKLVDTKRPERSYLLMKVKGGEGIVDNRMPVEAPPLVDEEIEIIEKWIFSLKEPEAVKETIKLEKPEKKKTSPELKKK